LPGAPRGDLGPEYGRMAAGFCALNWWMRCGSTGMGMVWFLKDRLSISGGGVWVNVNFSFFY